MIEKSNLNLEAKYKNIIYNNDTHYNISNIAYISNMIVIKCFQTFLLNTCFYSLIWHSS